MIIICLKKKEPTVRQLRRKAQKHLKNIGYKTKLISEGSRFIVLRIVKGTRIPLNEKLIQRILYLDISSLRERGIKETVDIEIEDLLDNILPF